MISPRTVMAPSGTSSIPFSAAPATDTNGKAGATATVTLNGKPTSVSSYSYTEPYALAALGALMPPEPIGKAPTELQDILELENGLVFQSFTADTAWALGSHLRNRLHAISPKPVVIQISTPHAAHLLFGACSHPGTSPDASLQAARMIATVLRFGRSSWYMGRRFGGDERGLAAAAVTATATANGVVEGYESCGRGAGSDRSEAVGVRVGGGPVRAGARVGAGVGAGVEAAAVVEGRYALHGGAVPVRVAGVEGVVAVVAVRGLTPGEDHMVACEGMEDCIEEMRKADRTLLV